MTLAKRNLGSQDVFARWKIEAEGNEVDVWSI